MPSHLFTNHIKVNINKKKCILIAQSYETQSFISSIRGTFSCSTITINWHLFQLLRLNKGNYWDSSSFQVTSFFGSLWKHHSFVHTYKWGSLCCLSQEVIWCGCVAIRRCFVRTGGPLKVVVLRSGPYCWFYVLFHTESLCMCMHRIHWQVSQVNMRGIIFTVTGTVWKM